MSGTDPRYDRVWQQSRIPVVVRGGTIRPLLVKLPYASDNREWLKNDRRTDPEWLREHKAWSIPKTWFEDTVQRLLGRHRSVYVIQPIKRDQKCAPACWNAAGAECECSCLGANHGSGTPAGKWYVASDSFAVRIDGEEFACRLLRPH